MGFAFGSILLCHIRRGRCRATLAPQQGHRARVLTSALTRRARMVATEFGTWRSGRKGGSSGLVTFGNGRRLEQRGGTRS